MKNLSNLPYKDNLYRCFDFVTFVTLLNMAEQENYVILSVVSVMNGVEISMSFNLIHKDHFNRFFDYANAPLRMTLPNYNCFDILRETSFVNTTINNATNNITAKRLGLVEREIVVGVILRGFNGQTPSIWLADRRSSV